MGAWYSLSMSNAPKFALRLPPVKPGDFGPVAYAVWSEDYGSSEAVFDGDLVVAVGEVRVETEGAYDDMYEVEYRKVRTSSGFVGTVCWHDFDGRSGFEAV